MRASTVCMCADVPGASVILRQLSGADLRPVHSFQQHEAAPVSQVHARRCTSLSTSPPPSPLHSQLRPVPTGELSACTHRRHAFAPPAPPWLTGACRLHIHPARRQRTLGPGLLVSSMHRHHGLFRSLSR